MMTACYLKCQWDDLHEKSLNNLALSMSFIWVLQSAEDIIILNFVSYFRVK